MKGKRNVSETKLKPNKNFNRGGVGLHWEGMHDIKSVQSYQAELAEIHGNSADETENKLFCGDVMQVLGHLLKDYKGLIRMIYIDIPYGSGKTFSMQVRLNDKKRTKVCEIPQYSDVCTGSKYLQFIFEVIRVLRDLLADNGCIYVQCNEYSNYHVREILDMVFGKTGYVCEIICHYNRVFTSHNHWCKSHDTIFMYSNSKNYLFNVDEVRAAYSTATIKRRKSAVRKESSEEYTLHNIGKCPHDVIDVYSGARDGYENTGYPNQKSEELLKKLISASSNEGDIILDCFMGSGTAINAAMKLNRRFIGADMNPRAVEITSQRLIETALNSKYNINSADFCVYNVDNSNYVNSEKAEAEIYLHENELTIRDFRSDLLTDLIENSGKWYRKWKELVTCVMIDPEYDENIFKPAITDIPPQKKHVKGVYNLPVNARLIAVKIVDVMYNQYIFTVYNY